MTYTAQKSLENGTEVVRLKDTAKAVEIAIATTVGNRAFEMKAAGENFLYFPFASAADLAKDSRGLNGIPFLAPWGNRIAGGRFAFEGKYYNLDINGGHLRLDANGLAIHGMLYATPLWEVLDLGSDSASAWVTSKLEFWKYHELMTNWPFAHEYEMTHRLTETGLEVHLAIRNVGAETMPVSIGFHPYFQLPGVPRDQYVIHVPARQHVETDSQLVATGEFKPADLPDRASLKDYRFDDGFIDLAAAADGRTRFYVEGGDKKIDVTFGPKYPVAIVYAPPGHEYVCFEPMAAVTNGINLAADGKYPALQTVKPGETWSESFWIAFR